MARILLYAAKSAEALAACKLARADQEALAAVSGASNDARRDLADTLTELGYHTVVDGQARGGGARVPHGGWRSMQKLVDENPVVTEFRIGLANSHMYLGNVLSLTGKPAEAEAELRTALAIYQKLADENPAFTVFRR